MNRLNYRSLRGGPKKTKKKPIVIDEDDDNKDSQLSISDQVEQCVNDLTARSLEKRLRAIHRIKYMTKTFTLPDIFFEGYLNTAVNGLFTVCNYFFFSAFICMYFSSSVC